MSASSTVNRNGPTDIPINVILSEIAEIVGGAPALAVDAPNNAEVSAIRVIKVDFLDVVAIFCCFDGWRVKPHTPALASGSRDTMDIR